MNKIKMNFALIAILLGTTFGVATAGTYRAATLYWNCGAGAYLPIEAGFEVQCDDNPTIICKAEGTVENPIPLENDQKGCGHLVPIPALK